MEITQEQLEQIKALVKRVRHPGPGHKTDYAHLATEIGAIMGVTEAVPEMSRTVKELDAQRAAGYKVPAGPVILDMISLMFIGQSLPSELCTVCGL